jgi:hypothetical protein
MRTFVVVSLIVASLNAHAQAPVYPTPQAAFNGGIGAIQHKQYRLFVDSLTNDSQTLFAAAMVMVSGMIAAFAKMDQHPKPKQKAAIQRLTAVLNKHGLTEQYLNSQASNKPPASKNRADIVAALGRILTPVKDKKAFLSDLLGALDSMPGDNGFSKEIVGGKLANLKVAGSHATAQILSSKPGKKPEPIAFRKVGPGWKIELPETGFAQMSGGPPQK